MNKPKTHNTKEIKKKNSVIEIKKIKPKRKEYFSILAFKLILVAFLLFGLYYFNTSYSNTISLLAVNENGNGEIGDGSVVKLTLIVKPGTGQTFVNLNTVEEVDTQVSIVNSEKIACDLFNLDCNKYDFYYNFEGSALVLKGPSASSAIAILTAKTVKKQNLNEKIVITGSLNSGGLIGNVGGVDQKIKAAEKRGFEKVIVPIFSDINESNYTTIEVIKALDIVEAYNYYNGKFEIKNKEINTKNYEFLMKNLADKMCERSYELLNRTNLSLFTNTSDNSFAIQGNKSLNSSINAARSGNYYSQGSFCFNSNINYRILNEREKNLTMKEINKNLEEMRKETDLKYVIVLSDEYKQKIKTINDFYVYLLVSDRISEARDYIKQAQDLKYDENKTSEYNLVRLQKENLYAYAQERLYTVSLWEELITNQGTSFEFNDDSIEEACIKISKDISLKSELLKSYGITFFNDDINKQNELSSNPRDKFLCIYKGLELNGRLNAVLTSASIKKEEQENYSTRIVNFAKTRLGLHSNGEFPLIPYIYTEYSQDLLKQGDYGSSILYSNYAISYADLNLYLNTIQEPISFSNEVMIKLFSNPVFIGCILLVIALMS